MPSQDTPQTSPIAQAVYIRALLRAFNPNPLRLGVLRRIISDIATTAAYCEPVVYQRKNRRKQAVPNHRIQEILSEPSTEISAYEQRRTTLARYLLESDAYLEIRYNFGNQIAGFDLPENKSVYPTRDALGNLVYQDRHKGITLDPDELCHFRGLNLNGYHGISLLEDNVELELAQSALEYAADYFKNGANIAGFFSSTMGLSLDERNRIQSIIDNATGPGTAHQALMLGSDVQWNAMGSDPEKSQLHESRQASIEDIARMLGYPLKKLSGDTSEDVRNEYVECVRLHLEVFEREYTFKLLTREERRAGYFIEHDLSSFKRSQTTAKIDDYAKVFGFGVVTPNEVREALNLEPSDDPNADVPYVAVNNLAAVGSQEAKDALEPLDEAVQDEPEQAKAEGQGVYSEALRTVFSDAVGRVYRRSRKALGKTTSTAALEKTRETERTYALETLRPFAALAGVEVQTVLDHLSEACEAFEETPIETLVTKILGGTNG